MKERDRVAVDARAKINLFLRVLGRRPDGYHDIETLIVPIGLADRLEFRAVSDPSQFRTLSLSLEVTGDPALVAGVPADASNLIIRAAAALAERNDVRGFADIRLEKRVPAAGGLGGGSADAAATLSVLNGLWECALTSDQLEEVAAEVGSDVPSLMAGTAALARGRGERVEPRPIPSLNLALAIFDFGVSSAEAYRWWDEDGGATGPDPAPVLNRLDASPAEEGGVDVYPQLLSNDLEEPVVRRHPLIGAVKSKLLAAGVVDALMSGSGPTVFGVLPTDVERLDGTAEDEIERMTGRTLMYVRTEASPG